MAVNKFVFQNGLSNDQINGPSLIVSACILQYAVRRFPSLQLREESVLESPEMKPATPYFMEVEPVIERLIRYLKVKRHAPHTLLWIPLSFYPYILGGIGISQLLSLR